VVALLALALALLGGVGYRAWRQGTAPQPPAVALDRADPEVAEVIEAARAAVRKSPRSGAAWGHLGMVLLAHGCDAEAVVSFARAEQFDPRDGRWPYYRALIVLLDHPEEGLEHLERAARLVRDHYVPQLKLAEVLLENGRNGEAEEQFRRVLEWEPREPRAHLGLAQLAFRRRDWKASRDHLEQARAAAPEAKAVRALLVEVHFRTGDRKAAEAEARAMAGLPDNQAWPDPYLAAMEALKAGLEGRLEAAERLARRGRLGEALEQMRAAVQRYPDSPKARRSLARLCLQAGRADEAESALREAARRNKGAAGPMFDLGLLLRQGGRYADAAAWFRDAARIHPEDALAHYHLGCCLREQGDLEGAARSFRAALRYKPDLADGHRDLGEVLARQGDAAAAARSLHRAVRLAPDDERARELLAKVQKPSAPEKP
jgi:tetratricopeptide (TPR) repeat protein